MRSYLVIALVLTLVGVALSVPAKNRKLPCITDCGDTYKPICVGNGKDKPKSFGSECVLKNYNCEHNDPLHKVSDGECPGGGGVRLS